MDEQELRTRQAFHLVEDVGVEGELGIGERVRNVVDLPSHAFLGPPCRDTRAPQAGADHPDEEQSERHEQSIPDAKAHD